MGNTCLHPHNRRGFNGLALSLHGELRLGIKQRKRTEFPDSSARRCQRVHADINGCFQACFTCQNIASTSPLICYNVAPVLILHGDSSSIPPCICRVVINKLPFVCVATVSSEPSAFKDAVIVLCEGQLGAVK